MAEKISTNLSALVAFIGRHEGKLFNTLRNKLADTLRAFTFLQDVKNAMEMTKLTVNKGPRPYLGRFKSFSGDLKYTGRKLETSKFQRDVNIDPEEYRTTYLAEFTQRGQDNENLKKNIPFEQYTILQVLDELAAQLDERTIFYGLDKADFIEWDALDVYAAGDLVFHDAGNDTEYWRANAITIAGEEPGVSAKWDNVTVEACFPGFKMRLDDAIAADLIDETAIGVIDNSGVFAHAAFLELWRGLSEAYKKEVSIAYCSFTDFELLVDDIKTNVLKTSEDIGQNGPHGGIWLPFSFRKCEVVPMTCMAGSRRIIVTPQENMLVGTDRQNDINKMKAIEQHYTVEYSMTSVMGTQIRDFGEKDKSRFAMVINDQD